MELPVGFYSSILRGAELKYSTSEIAVVCAINHFDVFRRW